MATSIEGPYDVWLTETLVSASSDIDTDVFVSYIIGILEEDDSPDDEKNEGIEGLLSGVVEADVASSLCATIMTKWTNEKAGSAAKTTETMDKGDQLSAIFAQQTLATVQEKKLTKEEKERKAAILAQYATVSDGEESEEEEDMEANSNKEEVARAERELREKSKAEAEAKREKDKQDRIAQKQKAEERKDKEKNRTQKQEKRSR